MLWPGPKFLKSMGFLFFFGFLTGCGPREVEEDQDDQDEIAELNYYSVEPPLAYELSEPECQRQTGAVDVQTANVWGWMGANIGSTRKVLAHTQSTQSLGSSIISATVYDRRYFRQCNDPSGIGQQCVDTHGNGVDYVLNGDDNFLRVCQSNSSYARETYEGVALTTIFYLNKAADYYRETYGRSLAKIRLEVLPHFQTVYRDHVDANGEKQNVSTWITNNLAYFPDSAMIAVFPETEQKAKQSKDHFWESAFVGAHELGHHIEANLVGSDMKALGLSWDPQMHAYSGSDTRNDTARMWNSVSEAYADLKAFYTEGGRSEAIARIECLGGNRDVGQKMFADGYTKKVLEKRHIETYLAGRQATVYCNQINYSDAHIIGAILATALDEVFGLMLSTHPAVTHPNVPQDNIRLRYRLSDLWLKTLVKLQKRQTRDANLLTTFPDAIEETLNQAMIDTSFASSRLVENATTIRNQICMKSKDLLPALERAPFSTNGVCPF